MLIALLIAISLGVWFQSFRIFEREPRAQQIAMQVVSVVKLTRAALLYSDPSRRRFLLLDLVQNEGIKPGNLATVSTDITTAKIPA